MKSATKRGFTLIELLVVIGMIGMLMAALTSSVASAQRRAKVSKAESEVKIITQAIYSYENWDKNHELPVTAESPVNKGSLGFLLGDAQRAESGEVPVLLMAAFNSGTDMLDPWQRPYKVSIRKGRSSAVDSDLAGKQLRTSYYLPNFYRLSAEERR